jgi:hypothetical protein
MTKKTKSKSDQENTKRSRKVARVIAEYDLDEFGVELEQRWLGDGRDQQSLRTLADVMNRRVLKSAMADAGMLVRQDEVDQIYTLLTDDETTEGTRVEVINELKREGVDIDTIQNDFVSHQAIHTYLRKDRGAERDDNNTDQVTKTQETIKRLQGRLQAVADNNIKSLISTGRLVVGSFDVIITIQIVCTDCNQQYDIFELFDRGQCKCKTET